MARAARRPPISLIQPRCLMSLVQPGSIAPDFSAEASDGRTYQLRSLLQESRVLLVFYPGNNTPG